MGHLAHMQTYLTVDLILYISECLRCSYSFMLTCNFRLKLQNIIQKLSEHCDIKNPEELETFIVSIYIEYVGGTFVSISISGNVSFLFVIIFFAKKSG